jgi:CRP/FNR family transcriptional regulator, anaerobic regulatory protein
VTSHKTSASGNGRRPRISCQACPLRGLGVFRNFEPSELAFVQKFKSDEIELRSGESLTMEGEASKTLYTLLSGWLYRYKLLPDGRRQVLNFVLPGDFIGLQTAVFGEAQHTVEALSDSTLCVFPRDKLWRLYNTEPGLGFDVTWLAAREEKMLDDNLLSIGRRSAAERVAFVIIHLLRRLRELKLSDGSTFETPFNQQHLADTLGLSLVHTNKTIRKLTRLGLVHWKDRTLAVLDEKRLVAIAQYDRDKSPPRPLI